LKRQNFAASDESRILDSASEGSTMITAAQLRAARALLGIDQRELASQCGLSVPTIQRMEGSDGFIRGNVDSLMKLMAALDSAGIDLIGEGAVSQFGGRGVRLKGLGAASRGKPMAKLQPVEE
jgi:transcriptional regulator with XRE-family HTH domain